MQNDAKTKHDKDFADLCVESLRNFAMEAEVDRVFVNPDDAKLYTNTIGVILAHANDLEGHKARICHLCTIIDNIMIKALTRKEFFLTKANRLLEETRLLINKTNFHLQAIMIPTDHSYDNENTDILCENIKKIKNNCQKINTLLENHQAEDTLHRQAQEKAKQTLNTLVTENLELSERIEKLSQTSGV